MVAIPSPQGLRSQSFAIPPHDFLANLRAELSLLLERNSPSTHSNSVPMEASSLTIPANSVSQIDKRLADAPPPPPSTQKIERVRRLFPLVLPKAKVRSSSQKPGSKISSKQRHNSTSSTSFQPATHDVKFRRHSEGWLTLQDQLVLTYSTPLQKAVPSVSRLKFTRKKTPSSSWPKVVTFEHGFSCICKWIWRRFI